MRFEDSIFHTGTFIVGTGSGGKFIFIFLHVSHSVARHLSHIEVTEEVRVHDMFDRKDFMFISGGIGTFAGLFIGAFISPWALVAIPLGILLIVLAFRM